MASEITEENTHPEVPAIDNEAISEILTDAFHGDSTSNIIEEKPLEAGNGALIVASSKIETKGKNKSNLGKKIKKIIADVTSWRSSKNQNPQGSIPGESSESDMKRSSSLIKKEKSKVKRNSYWGCYSFRREVNNNMPVQED